MNQTRICKVCQLEKPMKSFSTRKANKTNPKRYHRHMCSTCVSRKYKSTPNGRAKIRQIAKNNRIKYQNQIHDMKYRLLQDINQSSCKICVCNNVELLVFHHRSQEQKEFGVAYGFAHKYSYETLLKEAKKCDILCQNCHTKCHYKGTTIVAKKKMINKLWLIQQIGQICCKNCSEKDPVCLCFHHRDASQKRFKIADKLAMTDLMPAVLEEAKKCDILCMNCHTEFHAKEGRAFSQKKLLQPFACPLVL